MDVLVEPLQQRDALGNGLLKVPVIVLVLNVADADHRIEAQSIQKAVFQPARDVVEEILTDLRPPDVEPRVRKRSVRATVLEEINPAIDSNWRRLRSAPRAKRTLARPAIELPQVETVMWL